MSTTIDAVGPFKYETVDFELTAPATLHIRGQIAIQDPTKQLQPYLRRVHEAAMGSALPELEVDIVQLNFVNSSAIRLFIDWAKWVQDGGKPYLLVFRTDQKSMWQRSAFTAIRAMAGDAIRVIS
jgi:hypothetical protein